jgi:signal peptidase I
MRQTASEDQETSISGNQAPDQKSGGRRRGRQKLFTGFGGVLLVILALAIFMFFNFQTVVVSGRSMFPTFHTGNRVVVSKAYWLVGSIKDGDIVVLKDIGPSGTSADAPKDAYIIKRVNKMGGETVDWKLIPKNYPIANGAYKVPEGYIYVLGDNLPESSDSREFGPRKVEDILGKVLHR